MKQALSTASFSFVPDPAVKGAHPESGAVSGTAAPLLRGLFKTNEEIMDLKPLCRLLLTTDLSNRQIAVQCHVSPNTAARYRKRLLAEALSWDMVNTLAEDSLDARLNTGRERCRKHFIEPDWQHIHDELPGTGVTLSLLYEEYAANHESGIMSDREFRRRYERYRRSLGLVMRQPLRPGEQLFVDYSGKLPSITNPKTGEKTSIELWVGVLGAGRKTFVYATASQQLPDWIEAHVRALEYFGVTPQFLVSDNLKSGVVCIQRHGGHVINPTYQDFANHYDIMVMPTRARAPRDKASVEGGVRLVQRWILARLRNRTFYSLAELNVAIAELVEQLNNKPMRSRGGKSRNELFEALDRPAMHPLPQHRYEFAEWKVGIVVANDYHVSWERHYYSVPNRLVASKVDVRATVSTIDVFHRGKLVASHPRCDSDGESSTCHEHQPPAHRIFSEERAAELIAWAQSQGTHVSTFLQHHLQKHPAVASLQAFKGLKRMSRDFGAKRLDRACHRALLLEAINVGSIHSMLVRGIEDRPVDQNEAANDPLPVHANVRGAKAYE